MAQENVIRFAPRTQVYKMEMAIPPFMIISDTPDEITLEIANGKCIARIAATSLQDAKQRLSAVFNLKGTIFG